MTPNGLQAQAPGHGLVLVPLEKGGVKGTFGVECPFSHLGARRGFRDITGLYLFEIPVLCRNSIFMWRHRFRWISSSVWTYGSGLVDKCW